MIMQARRGVGTEVRPTLEELEQVFKETECGRLIPLPAFN